MKLAWLGIAMLFTQAAPAQETFSASPTLDAVVEAAVRDGLIPGAVLIIGHDGKIVHRKAYGSRALVPQREPMTADTIFDIASLTKVVATTPALMKLFEQGKLRINDPVTAYLPDFQGGRSDITVRDLLTHFSGLPPDLSLDPSWTGYDTGIRRALIEKPTSPPATRFVYSDINFELLGEIVHRLSGKPLDEFARDAVFAPLGMRETIFSPRSLPAHRPHRDRPRNRRTLPRRSARSHRALHGRSSRPRRRLLHRQRSSEIRADDARRRRHNCSRPSPSKSSHPPTHPPINPSCAASVGTSIPATPRRAANCSPSGSYGHTGFTGPSLWIDPASKTYIILMTNSVHPKGGKNLNPLRSKIATVVAAAFGVIGPAPFYETLESAGVRRMTAPNHEVLTGLDVLEAAHFAELSGKRVGLITNHTGLDRTGQRNIDAMRAAGVKLTAIFSPEHGLTGKEDRPDVADDKDLASGLPVRSLYNDGRNRLTPAMLSDVDVLVFDIQDAGARFYTYSCTMLYALEDAAKSKLPFYVLDRPNPVTGVHVEGPHARRQPAQLHRLLQHARAPRPDARRTSHHGQRRAPLQRRSPRSQNEKLAAW